MLAQTPKLYKQIQTYTDKATISKAFDSSQIETDRIDIRCIIVNEPISIEVFVEKYDFEVRIGNLLTLDKVEGQETSALDISGFVFRLLDAVKHERAWIIEHKLLGRKAHSLFIQSANSENDSDAQIHTNYETLTSMLVKKLGSRHAKGALKLR